ncbi:N-acyl homoserine lactonase family protein [Marispirochaeta sp.]|uniref:N-acyl homoserine lactonase family protein n=1 Tax=Marispirochaeta sp. TaxID=2038653 RepID=UPI0029C747CE|nr:N-acyl homoserine lactonase family protein [Marispirochaeta sp.]
MKSPIVYPIKLATVKDVDYSHNVLNTRFGEKIDAAFLSYLIVVDKFLMIVDTGHTLLSFTKGDNMNIIGDAKEAYESKFQELRLEFNDVTHIILTHMHWDHMQNNHLFPNARIYVQRKEVEYAAAPLYPLYYEKADVAKLIGEDGDRVVFLDGDTELAPGVKTVLVGGHTPGSQIVYVNTSDGMAIITGDICNVYENLEVRSVKEMDVLGWVRAINKIKKDGDIILPMHEERVIKDYPQVGK